MDDQLLGIYLNDHLGGATLGARVARRTLSSNEEGSLGDFLRTLVREIDEDRDTLVRVMEALGVRQNPAKQAGALAAEVAGRMKLNGRVFGYSPLSRLEELEALALGVIGKRLLWQVLRELQEHDSRLEGYDFDTLIARAEAQRKELERFRQAAATRAFTG